MKITKRQLKNIIREENIKVIREGDGIRDAYADDHDIMNEAQQRLFAVATYVESATEKHPEGPSTGTRVRVEVFKMMQRIIKDFEIKAQKDYKIVQDKWRK